MSGYGEEKNTGEMYLPTSQSFIHTSTTDATVVLTFFLLLYVFFILSPTSLLPSSPMKIQKGSSRSPFTEAKMLLQLPNMDPESSLSFLNVDPT